ncbi:dynamin-related protein 4C-like [Bidens hawaiensis]|uniref:dynamin-related protein 4C-like n=1 Tax=Bidens hawaiensis TaxID=980011 RepID=UPI004049F92A
MSWGTTPHLFEEYTKQLKEPLEMIKELSDMNIFARNRSFPTIYKPSIPKIVLLDEGKAGASVVNALVGLSIPFDFGIPIVLNFKTDSTLPSSLRILFQFREKYYLSQEKEVSEPDLKFVISKYMKEVVPKLDMSNVEVILTVVQPVLCELTIICLPEICKQDGKGNDISEITRFQGYIKGYVKAHECLFLNLLSCSSNLDDSLSEKILFGLDPQGTHTLRVFTQLGSSSKQMISRLINKTIDHPTRFGYFFIDQDDPETKIDIEEFVIINMVGKEFVGFEEISKQIVLALLAIIYCPSSQLLVRIDSDLQMSKKNMKSMSKTLKCMLLLSWFCKFTTFRNDMRSLKIGMEKPFLSDEIQLLDDRKWHGSAKYVPSIIGNALNKNFSYAYDVLEEFVSDISNYIGLVVVAVLVDHSKEHLQLHPYFRHIGRMWTEDLKNDFRKKLQELLNLEKSFIYSCNDDYETKVKRMKNVKLVIPKELTFGEKVVSIEGIGEEISVEHLVEVSPVLLEKAFDLKKQMNIYWEFVVGRLVDNCALNLFAIITEMLGNGILRKHMEIAAENNKLPIMEPRVSYNEAALKNRIACLKNAKNIIESWQFKFEYLFSNSYEA